MKKPQNKLTGILDTEGFGSQNRQYYLDIKQTSSRRYYLRITRRDQTAEETFQRHEIIFFEEDIQFLVEAMTMLLGRYSAGQLGISA